MNTKTIKCSECKEYKEIIDYVVGKTTVTKCISCRHLAQDRYRTENRDKINEQQRLKRKAKRKEHRIILKMPQKDTPEFIFLLNKFISKNAANERKRKYVKYINIKDIMIDKLDLNDKIVSFNINNYEELLNTFEDFKAEFGLLPNITNGFLLKDKVVGLFADLVFLNHDYKEIMPEKVIGEKIDVAGQIIVDYHDRHNSIVFLVKYIKLIK